MTISAEQLLAALRNNAEDGHTIDKNGNRWQSVYLDNATGDLGLSGRRIGGLLAALSRAGLYRPIDGTAFGDVLMSDNTSKSKE